MQKSIVLLCCIVLLAQANLFQQRPPPARQCDATYYGNRGETCDGNMRKCKWFYICKNGVCTYGNIGAVCSTKEDCFGQKEENLRCVNNRCVKPRYPSYECTDSQECWTGTCVNGFCSGKKEGEDCDAKNLAECDKGLYCSLRLGKCVKQLRTLSVCNDYVYQDDIPQGANYNVICPGGQVCMGPYNETQLCRPYRNGPLGSPCNWYRDGDDGCEFGLRCSRRRSVCIAPNVDYPTYACQGSPRNCSFAEGESCICQEGSTTVGTCRTRTDAVKCDENKAMNDYRECMRDNNCPYEKNFVFSFLIDPLDKKTCLGKYCGLLARKYLCCAASLYRRIKFSPSSSGVLKCDELAPQDNSRVVIGVSLAIVGLISVAAIFVFAFGIGLYFYIKKTRSNLYIQMDQ